MSARLMSNWFVHECQQSIKGHQWQYEYYMQAGSPRAAAVYQRAIARVTRCMEREKAGKNQKYQPNKAKAA